MCCNSDRWNSGGGGTIADSSFSGSTPILLNGATNQSKGVIVRLSRDGKEMLSITRLSLQVKDMECDGNDHIFVANEKGPKMLNPSAKAIVKSFPSYQTIRAIFDYHYR